MRAHVDESTCIGCGICEGIAPDVFQMEDGVSKVIGDVTEDNQASVQEAVDSCPVDAITLEEE